VKQAAARNGISLRPAGERRGLLLGQPRGYHVPPDQRKILLDSGNYDKLLAAYGDLMRGKGELCPNCAKRPITTRDGFCAVCQMERVAEMAEQRADEAERRLRVWRGAKRYSRAGRGRGRSLDERDT
jgi:hypothetical protein